MISASTGNLLSAIFEPFCFKNPVLNNSSNKDCFSNDNFQQLAETPSYNTTVEKTKIKSHGFSWYPGETIK